MSDLDFSLPPEAEKAVEKTRRRHPSGGGPTWLSFLILAAVVVVLILQVRGRNSGGILPGDRVDGAGSEVTADLALKLERRGLSSQAAVVWERHLAQADLPDRERANLWFKVGKLHQEAGNFESAIESYYRAEMAGEPGSEEGFDEQVQLEVNRRVQECFERLGRFTALEEELTDRTRVRGSAAVGSQEGDVVLAEIGKQKITQRDLDRILEQALDLQLEAMGGAGLLPEQRLQYKEQLLSQVAGPDAKMRVLNQAIDRELLYRLARRNQIEEREEVSALVDDTVRQLLGSLALDEEVQQRVQLTDSDYETYYRANRERYRQTEQVRLSLVVSESEEAADRAHAEVVGGAEFADVARRFSVDETLVDQGGAVASADRAVLGARFQWDTETLDRIFATAPGALVAGSVQGGHRWYVVRVEAHSPAREPDYEEVQDRVRKELLNRKGREVVAELLSELREEEGVIIHAARLARIEEDLESEDEDEEEGEAPDG